tara:strand:+ start:1870 stop:2265 length:396 start_codon:yes stop_codon:yes gene_type:complete
MKKKISDPLVYSNLLFFINAFLYGVGDFHFLGVVMGISAMASLIYHYRLCHVSGHADRFCAASALGCILTTCFLYMDIIDFMIMIFLASLSLIWKRYGDSQTDIDFYRVCHLYWHIIVFICNLIVFLVLRK